MIEDIRYIRSQRNLGSVKLFESEVYSKTEVGEIYIHNLLKQSEKIFEIGEFLTNNISQLINVSNNIIQNTQNNPYIYKEEEFRKIVMSILAKSTEGFLISSSKFLQRSLDKLYMKVPLANYVCHCKGQDYYIEVNKRSISYNKKHLMKDVKDEWENSCKKLISIKNTLEDEEDVVGITIQVLNIYVSEAENGELDYNTDALNDMRRNIIQEISEKYPAQCSCLWIMNKEIIKPYEYIHGSEIYPAVLFLVNIQ